MSAQSHYLQGSTSRNQQVSNIGENNRISGQFLTRNLWVSGINLKSTSRGPQHISQTGKFLTGANLKTYDRRSDVPVNF